MGHIFQSSYVDLWWLEVDISSTMSSLAEAGPLSELLLQAGLFRIRQDSVLRITQGSVPITGLFRSLSILIISGRLCLGLNKLFL